MKIVRHLALTLWLLSTLSLQSSGMGAPNKFVTEHESYRASSYIFPTAVSIGLLSGLCFTHIKAHRSRWYQRLERRAVQEKRAQEEKARRDREQAELAKREADRLKKDAELAAKLEEENRRNEEAKKAADARRAQIATQLENDIPVEGECPLCLEDNRPLYASCENLHRYCVGCLQKYHQDPNGCFCRAPYIITNKVRGLWGNANQAAADPLNNVD